MKDYRQRLIDGLTFVLEYERKTLAAITIADVVAAARVSKRTFYEHFNTKEACFLALYEQNSFRILEILTEHAQREIALPTASLERILLLVLNTYVNEISTRSGLMARLYIDILGIEQQGIELRYKVLHAFAQQIHLLLSAFDASKKLSIPEVLLFLSGINEMALYHLNDASLVSLDELHSSLAHIIQALLPIYARST